MLASYTEPLRAEQRLKATMSALLCRHSADMTSQEAVGSGTLVEIIYSIEGLNWLRG